ncbi:YrdB family protein [Bacillus sp. S13(2024)]|uniref:YrdB family protein n=1 Tax=unclassified Bacillus (in: firmicutes) TaxID=185979 RepID=UPI003D1E10C2
MFIKSVNLAIRFLLELCAIASLGYWGFQVGESAYTKFVFGIGSPLLLAILWGAFIAPKASLKLPEPYRFILELIIFGAASFALYFVDKPILAIILGMVFIINRILLIIWKQ